MTLASSKHVVKRIRCEYYGVYETRFCARCGEEPPCPPSRDTGGKPACTVCTTTKVCPCTLDADGLRQATFWEWLNEYAPLGSTKRNAPTRADGRKDPVTGKRAYEHNPVRQAQNRRLKNRRCRDCTIIIEDRNQSGLCRSCFNHSRRRAEWRD